MMRVFTGTNCVDHCNNSNEELTNFLLDNYYNVTIITIIIKQIQILKPTRFLLKKIKRLIFVQDIALEICGI